MTQQAHEIRLNNVETLRQLRHILARQEEVYGSVKRRRRIAASERAMWLVEILRNIGALKNAIEHLESIVAKDSALAAQPERKA